MPRSTKSKKYPKITVVSWEDLSYSDGAYKWRWFAEVHRKSWAFGADDVVAGPGLAFGTQEEAEEYALRSYRQSLDSERRKSLAYVREVDLDA